MAPESVVKLQKLELTVQPGPESADPQRITRLLLRWRDGQADALNELMPLIYNELRAMAHRAMSGATDGQTLPATAVVHEAFLRLSGTHIAWQDRNHFLAVAGRTMRRVLVDYARLQGRAKRGGRMIRATIEEATFVSPEPSDLIIHLDEAMRRLELLDERKARIVEMMYFGGMSHEETAEVLGISRATVQREAKFAKSWLYGRLHGESAEAEQRELAPWIPAGFN